MNLGERFDSEDERTKLYQELQEKDARYACDAMRALDVWEDAPRLRALESIDALLDVVRKRIDDQVALMEHMHYDVPLGDALG